MFAALLSFIIAASPGPAPVDFDTGVLAVLTRAGCNAASCHGAADGRGGFKLSLFGGDPAADYRSIVNQYGGRRINLVSPSRSLVLAKPTLRLEHEGGERFRPGSPAARLLTRWIEEGAARLKARTLTDVKLSVSRDFVEQTPGVSQATVIASFDDNTQRNVTATAVYTPDDPAAIDVDDAGRITVKRPGVHVIVVRYLSMVKAIQITAPLQQKPVDLSAARRGNWIDDAIYDKLQQLRVEPLPRSSDTVLLRRVYLDLTGKLPELASTRAYLDSAEPQKFNRLVSKLLDSPEFEAYFTLRLAKLFRIEGKGQGAIATEKFHSWLQKQLHERRGFDQIARDMLLTGGSPTTNGPANFYRAASDARLQAEYLSEKFMGVRLRCANCHNHPLDHWTQDDYHGLAAIFAPVQRTGGIRFDGPGQAYHPRTGQPAAKQIPGRQQLATQNGGKEVSGVAGLKALANWLTQQENPYFARSIVNRLWQMLMGRGLVEPVDDLRSTNPASHPAILKQLAKEFVEGGYRVRPILRTIAQSAAYQRASRTGHPGAAFYAANIPRPLPAEVLADAIADVTGVPDEYGDAMQKSRAIHLLNVSANAPSLEVLGRCTGSNACSTDGKNLPLTARAGLHLLNGPLLNRKLSAKENRLNALIESGKSDAEIISQCYQRALCRPPTTQEVGYWQKELAAVQGKAARQAVLEDFLWALLCNREFTLIR